MGLDDDFRILGAAVLGDLASEGVDVEVKETGYSSMPLLDEPAAVTDSDYIYGCDILGGVVPRQAVLGGRDNMNWTEILGGRDNMNWTEILGGRDNMNWTEILGDAGWSEILGGRRGR